MGKHAYMIVSNGNFSVLKTCLKLIDDSRNDVFLLFDKKARVSTNKKTEFTETIKKSNIVILDDIIINWGGFSQIKAVLCLLKETLKSDKYDYIHFFQGSDLPIKSQDDIHSYFDDNYKVGYQFVEIDRNRTYMAINKSWYRHYFCHNRFFRKNKFVKALNFGLVYLQKILKIKRNTDIELYQGSALFSITQDCAEFLVSKEKEIIKRFKYSLASDEVFIQTILMNSVFNAKIKDIDGIISSNARMIDRIRPDGKNSPHIWRESEAEYLLEQPKNYCFSRKFDENVDFNVVKKIYKKLKNDNLEF